MEKLTINDLPEDVVERMRRAIREDSQMIALKNKHSQYIINRQYAKAVLLKKKMQEIEERVIREYLDSYEGETEDMSNLMREMSPEDREYINTCTNAIILICDIILFAKMAGGDLYANADYMKMCEINNLFFDKRIEIGNYKYNRLHKFDKK